MGFERIPPTGAKRHRCIDFEQVQLEWVRNLHKSDLRSRKALLLTFESFRESGVTHIDSPCPLGCTSFGHAVGQRRLKMGAAPKAEGDERLEDGDALAKPFRGVREPSRRPGSSLCSGAQAWIQHSAGTCPNSWRDGFARDCPLRHPVLLMLALRGRAGAIVGFSGISGDFRRRGARSRDKEGGAGARRCAVSQRSSREPIFGSGLCTPRHPSCGRRMVDRTSARPNAVARVSQQVGWIPAISLECPGSNFYRACGRPSWLTSIEVDRDAFGAAGR